jgi:superfamily I DNA and RNA helicase
VLATTKAQSEAQKGKRVLFLCYNKALAEWLNSSVETGEIGSGYLHVDNYHHYVAQLCKDIDRKWPSNAPNLWNEYAPNQLYDIAFNLMSGRDKYDTIIIDEGQDFHPNWWMSITPLFRGAVNDHCFYVFYDPDQNIFQGQFMLPAGLDKPFPLTINCRNTKRISNYCAQIIANDMRVKKFAPEGIDPIFHDVSDLGSALTQAQNLAAIMIAEQQRLAMKQVAILCIGVPTSQIQTLGSRSGFTTDHKKWRNNQGVLVSDAGAFKGLESDLIIVIDNGGSDTLEVRSKRYVAFSRAKFELHIVNLN